MTPGIEAMYNDLLPFIGWGVTAGTVVGTILMLTAYALHKAFSVVSRRT